MESKGDIRRGKVNRRIVKRNIISFFIVCVLVGCSNQGEDNNKSLILKEENKLESAVHNLGRNPSKQDLEKARNALEEAYENISWDDLSIDFRVAQKTPEENFVSMTWREKEYFISPLSIINIKDIYKVDLFTDSYSENEVGLEIIFRTKGHQKFKIFTRNNIGKSVGIIIDNKLAMVARINEEISVGKTQVIGFSPNEAKDITNRYYKPLRDAGILSYIK